jgi:DeoR family transcriptional regulator, ulaG and ulaABCDEF operon transcriptional repressor
MLREERHTLIVKYLAGRDAVSYDELLSVIDASPATLRRDVDQLEGAGSLRKVRGGVAPVGSEVIPPLASYHFGGERSRNAAAKRAIAERALSLVAPNDTLILFGGTTVAGFAELLPDRGLSILTNSLPVGMHLSLNTVNRVYLTGGEVLARQGVMLSPFDDPVAQNIVASSFFVGCHGVCESGIMEEDSLPIHVFRGLRRHAGRVVVLADSSKFGERRSLILCRLTEIDVFVTDSRIAEADHQRLVDAGIEVLVADVAAD